MGTPSKITEYSGTWYVLAIQCFVRTFAETTLSKSASFANMISKVTQNWPAFFERINRASFPSFLGDVIENPLLQSSKDSSRKPMPNAPVGLIREIRGTDMPEIYLRLLVSQSLRSGNRMNIAAEIISINVIGRSQINWIPFALRIARPRLSSNICPNTKPISSGGKG